ncbi:hypothetical protein OXIME_000440 [Oxyplasma meridianum]|uniref:SHOCT domain-containing protein n=1 Tax=Oxyplasma meridianum TaxID=3073602 RepID=A0AAX4NEI6_9ARCH
MESHEMRRLKEMLDSGVIDKEVYDKILSRWASFGKGNNSKTEKESPGQNRTRNRGETVRVNGSSILPEVFAKEIRVSGPLK